MATLVRLAELDAESHEGESFREITDDVLFDLGHESVSPLTLIGEPSETDIIQELQDGKAAAKVRIEEWRLSFKEQWGRDPTQADKQVR